MNFFPVQPAINQACGAPVLVMVFSLAAGTCIVVKRVLTFYPLGPKQLTV